MATKGLNIEQTAKRIREEYDYLDTIPMEGWIWEIIRRSDKYRKICSTLQERKDVMDWDDPLVKQLDEYGIRWEYVGFKRRQVKNYVTYKIPFGEGLSLEFTPKPETRFREIAEDEMYFIGLRTFAIRGGDAIFESFFGLIDGLLNRGELKKLRKKYQGPELTGVIADLFINYMMPFFQEFVMVLLPKRVRLDDVRENLFPELRKYLTPHDTKIRAFDKWKYYLIIYDLRAEDQSPASLSYEAISSALSTAYPTLTIKKRIDGRTQDIEVEGADYFSPRNCENFWKSALSLINGGYKKYLYPLSIPYHFPYHLYPTK